MLGLTPELIRCKKFIRNFQAKKNFAPTVREIKKGIGVRSTSEVARLIGELIERGHAAKVPRASRSLTVIDHHTCRRCGHKMRVA